MKKIIKILMGLLVILFSNSYVYAENCGNYTYYGTNGEIDSVFHSGIVTVENNKCKLSYLSDSLFGEISYNSTIKDCNQCPDIIYAYCLSSDCSTSTYKLKKNSNLTFIGYWRKNIDPTDKPVTPGNPNEKYEGVEDCGDLDVNRIKACGCIPAGVADITSRIYFILRIVGPLLLLILGGFEMAKAISTQDESAISKAKKKLVNKFIAAAAIFLTLTIIKFIVGIVADDATSLFNCVEILLNGYVI